MKSFDSRVYSVHDFVEWNTQKALELAPRFQRRSVWSPAAKSYLIDTIIRGKPMPKVFMRQKINVSTRESVREIVDGQQRLRTILSFLNDSFVISKQHNEEHGGKSFSQLPSEIQEHILTYEISVDLLTNLPDAEILDIFGRLNSYAVTLNEQEAINANHFSAFKVLADEIGYKYNEFWIKQGIVSEKAILRMQEISLVADLLIAMIEGPKAKKSIKKYYAQYEKGFDKDIGQLSRHFDEVIKCMIRIYPEGIKSTEFSRVHLFYSLFVAIAHCLFGVSGLNAKRASLSLTLAIGQARNKLDYVGSLLNVDLASLHPLELQFVQDSRNATTDETVRVRRAVFLATALG